MVEAGVSGATVGLIVTPDQKLALQATGGTSSLNLGGGFASATATSVGVSYNNTGSDVDSTITGLGGVISAPVNVVDGVTSVTVTGLEATVVDFVTISGDFGLEKTAGGDLEVVGNSVDARLQLAGDLVDVGVTGAKLGVLVKADETLALQTTGGALSLNLGERLCDGHGLDGERAVQQHGGRGQSDAGRDHGRDDGQRADQRGRRHDLGGGGRSGRAGGRVRDAVRGHGLQEECGRPADCGG